MAFTMLIGGNGLVVWAEQTVPSGMAALIVATVPIWMAGLAALPPARERIPLAAVAGIVLGFLGVAVLVRPSAAATCSASRASCSARSPGRAGRSTRAAPGSAPTRSR